MKFVPKQKQTEHKYYICVYSSTSVICTTNKLQQQQQQQRPVRETVQKLCIQQNNVWNLYNNAGTYC